MKTLVTGATGFLGRFLTKSLQAQGHEVVALGSKECDLTQSTSLDNFNSKTYDHIYHLAAWTQAGDFNIYHPGEVWTTNQLINTHVLDWWQKRQPQAKLITMGTSCAYRAGTNLVEDSYLDGSPHESVYAYGMTKRMLYVGLKALNKQYGMKYLCFIPSTLYGPGYHNENKQLHFIFDLMTKIIRAKYQGETATLWGDGHQKRELVLISDFVSIMLKLAQTEENELINIGAGIEYPIRHFAELICNAIDYDPSLIQYDTTQFVGATSKCLDILKLKDKHPELEYTPLKAGIEETVKWFLESRKELMQV
ncbi:MAG: dTDP-4-oxo-6-deoxy-D-allose reductase [Chlamydiae bacterium]|nr:dTDP-4-oxo-6-deoxy-D-allose reductase [Chlamydiota bacterium]